MIIARVIGNVVSTQKHRKFDGTKLMVVQPLDLRGHGDGAEIIAVDSVGGGAGETVLVVIEGRSASQAMRLELAPANAAIVGVVDEIEWDQAEQAIAKARSDP